MWIRPNTPVSTDKTTRLFPPMTVQIQRHDAAERFQAILNGKADPGYEADEVDENKTK